MNDSLIHIGTSGWSYAHWTGKFYPTGLKNKRWLNYYSGQFKTVEINSSFYHLPTPQTFTGWKESTAADFLFSVKVSRYITHVKKLKDCREAFNRLLTAAKELGEKLGPFLFQLPPNMGKNEDRLEEFLKILPEKYKYAFEFRNENWLTDDIFGLLEDAGCAFVISSSPGFPHKEEITADFCYIRMHGPSNLYSSSYSNDELKKCASLIKKNLKKNIENYVYFNNDARGYAVENARTLLAMVS
jgi:uncharacterized protein YecE (DUF72 family)